MNIQSFGTFGEFFHGIVIRSMDEIIRIPWKTQQFVAMNRMEGTFLGRRSKKNWLFVVGYVNNNMHPVDVYSHSSAQMIE